MPRRFSSLLAVSLLLPIANSPAQRAPSTSPTFRTLASFTGERFVADPHPSPDGRFILLGTKSELRVYELATKRMTKLADGSAWELEWSRPGDRIAWVRAGDDDSGEFVWSMPIDPKTAKPTGPPQRVSIGQGSFPAISLDGRWIAYCAPETPVPGHVPHRLAVVPVTGGPERIIARFDDGFESLHWSADGKSIYVNGTAVGGKKAVVTKAFLDGHTPEVVRAGQAEWFAGMTADRRHIVLVPAKNPIAVGDSALIVDTTGKELGRVPLPVGSINEYDDALGDTALVWVDLRDHRRIEIRSVDGSAPKQLPLVGESNESPIWSPDGKHIAFQVRENGRYVLALMNADGTNARVLHDAEVRRDQLSARWSPDSKLIGFSSKDWRRFQLLDVASGKIRTILNDTAVRVGTWTWRADSRSIAAAMLKQQTPVRVSIEEISLSGERRRLLDVGPLGGVYGFQFVDGSTVAYRSDSAAFVVPLTGGPARRLVDIPAKSEMVRMAVSHDRRWFGGPIQDPTHREFNQIELISSETGQRRVIDVPFRFGFRQQPTFSADDRSLFVIGGRAGDTTGSKIYSVPIPGGSPRAIANLGTDLNGASVSLSPNGTAVAYSVQVNRTTSLLLVDLRPVLSRFSLGPSHR